MDEINVQIIDMDVMIPEQITRNSDGSYTIFLNARLTHEHRLQSYEHAIRHIKAGDFEKQGGDVQEIEAIAHSQQTAQEQSVAIYAPSKEFEERRAKALARIKRRRRKIEKQLKEYREDMEFIGADAPDVAFARAEHQWLYGKDL